MAKRQDFVVGSTNANTETLTTQQLNNGWDRFQVLRSGVLDGVFNAVSDYSNDSSNEIANAIQSITGSQPTGASQNELALALQQMRDEIQTTSLTFKGYVATTAPSSSTYSLINGDLWINSATMPTSFPIAATDIKQWDGTAWVNYGSTYTPVNFEAWRNVNDNNGYYWFGGVWVAMSTDLSPTYFSLNAAGKWEIKSSVNLPGMPTTTKPAATSSTSDTKIPTTGWVNDPTKANNVVHRSGYGEVITDPKRFHTSDDVPICLRNTTDDSNVAPSTAKATTVGIEDKNGKWQGGFEHYHHTDGTMVTQLAVRKQNDTGPTETYAHLSVAIRPDGSTWTAAPTPNTNSWDGNIATTAFVKNVLNAIWPVGAIYLSITNYCPLNGIIGNWELIQAGRALWTGNGQTGNYSWTGDKVTAAHNVIWEGLPNIEGNITINQNQISDGNGAFRTWSGRTFVHVDQIGDGCTGIYFNAAYFDNRYSMGRVQPEAYVVNVWRRIS